MVTPEDVVEYRHQVAVVINRKCAGSENMRPGAFHFPEGDVVSTCRAIRPGGNQLGKDGEESFALGLLGPAVILRFRMRCAVDAAQHKDYGRMGRFMCRMEDQIRPAVSVMDERACFHLRSRRLGNR